MTKRKVSKQKEAGGIILLGLALLLALIYWGPSGMSGPLGGFIRHLGRSLIGSAAYLSPLLLIYFALELFLAKEQSISDKRKLLALLMLLFVLTLIAIFALSPDHLTHYAMEDGKFKATRALKGIWLSGKENRLVHAGEFWSGGFVGSLVALGLLSLLGKVGAVLVTLVSLSALALLLFNFSYIYYFGKSYNVIKLKREELRLKREEQLQAKATLEEVLHSEPRPEAPQPLRRELELEEGWDAPQAVKSLRIKNRYEPPEHNDPFVAHDTAPPPLSFQVNPELDPQIPEEPLTFESQQANDLSFALPSGDWRVTSKDLSSFPDEEDKDSESNLAVETPNKPPQPSFLDEVAVAPKEEEDETVLESEEAIAQRAKELKALEESLQEETDRATWEDRSESDEVPIKKTFHSVYHAPPKKLLKAEAKVQQTAEQEAEIKMLGAKLEKTLQAFGIDAKVINYTSGPTISRFELVPGAGVKVSRIVNLADDIALALAAIAVRIEAPIPGKSAIGIEIPNKQTRAVLLRGILEDPNYKEEKAPLLAALGRDIQGVPILCDLSKMPHLLIAGATGSGKSVCINSILISLLYRTGPDDLRLLMIDPKVVELSVYNGIPQLLQPVVTDPKKATGVLRWAVEEMSRRYNLFANAHVRDFNSYNRWVLEGGVHENAKLVAEKLPYIVLVIDELSDLMATAAAEVEEAISRLTAMARAAGMHLIIATQRPSVDVITGVIKANIPSRIAFAVASQVDSRTILDQAGAEKLLGKGDMLYAPQSASKSLRGQGAFVTDREVESVVKYLKERYGEQYDEKVGEAIDKESKSFGGPTGLSGDEDELDELIDDAMRVLLDNGYASISLLQRRLNVGYPRAARMVDQLHDLGAIGPFEGSKPRKVVVQDMEAFLALKTGGENE